MVEHDIGIQRLYLDENQIQSFHRRDLVPKVQPNSQNRVVDLVRQVVGVEGSAAQLPQQDPPAVYHDPKTSAAR